MYNLDVRITKFLQHRHDLPFTHLHPLRGQPPLLGRAPESGQEQLPHEEKRLEQFVVAFGEELFVAEDLLFSAFAFLQR